MSKQIDLAGQSFGRWMALEYLSGDRWLCRCACGKTVSVKAQSLRNLTSRSCGCLRVDVTGARATIHGFARMDKQTRPPEYTIWCSMKERCHNSRNKSFPYYGGRGIMVCQRWIKSFPSFLEDMGPRPAGGTIERLDNGGNYEPGNCRWATRLDQTENRRTTRWIEFEGQRKTVSGWARHLGLPYQRLNQRLWRGWPVERVLSHDT